MNAGAPWLVSRRFDLLWLIGPLALGLLLVPLGPVWAEDGEVPPWLWLILVLLVDVAHVWSTLFRTYLDPVELRRHPLRYVLLPLACYLVGLLLASISTATFWRALAYLAVFHFVRQQYGWVALYQKKEVGSSRASRWLDGVAVYGATVVPLLWWHAQPSRRYTWFVPGDFALASVPPALADGLLGLYAAVLLLFLIVGLRARPVPVGKLLLVLGTASSYAVGIVFTNSDYAFTVTNVLGHGLPYCAFVWVVGAAEPRPGASFLGWLYRKRAVLVFAVVIVGLAYLEEWSWDRLFWHGDQPFFWGPTFDLSTGAAAFLLPLLALPQATHYALDAFIWRRADLAARRPAI